MSTVDKELEWLLNVHVGATISQLVQILNECTACISNTPKQYTLLQLDHIKIHATLEGYNITHADINIKHPIHTIKTCINHPSCWRLYQIQDTLNHLGTAIDLLTSNSAKQDFKSAEEVLQLVDRVMNSLQKSRTSLLIPKKTLIEELQHSQNMKSISPALPLDFSLSFYVQANNLVCSVYQLLQVNNNRPQVKAEFQAEVTIPMLSEVLVFLSLGLQTCQQLKDKLKTFLYV